jgi:hypothetical protein
MDVQLQILKHLKREAQSTVSIIDRYCEAYFKDIEKWWEIIMSAYLMISLNTQVFLAINSSLLLGLHHLIHTMNQFQPFYLSG